MKTAIYCKEINYCSDCPNCQLGEVYWDPGTEDEGQDLYCKELQEPIYEHLCWNEIASRCSTHTGLDRIPGNCPFLQETNNENNK